MPYFGPPWADGRWEPADLPELFEGVDTDVLTGDREHRVGAFLHELIPTLAIATIGSWAKCSRTLDSTAPTSK